MSHARPSSRTVSPRIATRRLRRRPQVRYRRLRIELLEARRMLAGLEDRANLLNLAAALDETQQPLTVHADQGPRNTAWESYNVATANDSLSAAFDLGTLDQQQEASDYVGPDDTVDYYRFTISDTVSEVTIHLQAHSYTYYDFQRLSLELIEDANNNGAIDAGEIIGFAFQAGTSSLTRWLDPGTYYVRVTPYQSGGASTYSLILTETPKPASRGRQDNSLPTALDVGILNGTISVGDFAGTSDTVDFVKFTVTAPVREVTLNLQSLWYTHYSYQNLSLALIEDVDGNGIIDPGEIFASASNWASSSLTRWLDPGVYYVRIVPYESGGNSTYTLTLTQTPKPTSPGRQDDRPTAALDVGILNGALTVRDFVGTSDTRDFVAFSIATPAREVTVSAQAHWYTSYASQNLTIDLIHDANQNGVIDSGEILGSASQWGNPWLKRVLNPGKYYVQIRPYATDGNSTYTLTLSTPHEPILDLQPGEFQRTDTGFIYPTGRGAYATSMPDWLAGGPGKPPYHTGYYHLGTDMDAPRGAPVYAIADGEIVYVSTSGWGPGNYGLFIRHRLENGEPFFALYGHVRPVDSTLRLSGASAVHPRHVRAGEIFATIGPADGWTYDDDHLHFGIRPAANIPPAPFGRMPLGNWPETNGFVDPLAYIRTQRPSGAWTSHGTMAPTGLSADALAPNQVQLTWQASSNEVTGVQIERRASGQSGWESVTQLWGQITSFVDQTVDAATSYFYRVRDWMGGLLSNYSGEVSIDTPKETLTPGIFGIEPQMPLANDTVQTVTIRGKYFLPGITIGLRPPNDEPFCPADINRNNEGTRIIFAASFGTKPGKWKLELQNPGEPTLVQEFTVVRDGQTGITPIDGYDYPIGHRGYEYDEHGKPIQQIQKPEFPHPDDETPETNDLYSVDNVLPGTYRGRANTPSSGWYNAQDVGSYLGMYNNVVYGGIHPGEDWNLAGSNSVGEPVHAVGNGRVVRITTEGGGTVVLLHDDRSSDKQYYSIYTHVIPVVESGAAVFRGDVIAHIAAVTPPHLHFEMRETKDRDLSTKDIHPRDFTNLWYYHDGDGPYAHGMTAEQVTKAFQHMRNEGIIDPSDFIDRNRTPASTGSVQNGLWGFGSLSSWYQSGAGHAAVVNIPELTWPWWVQMTTKSPVTLSQAVTVPERHFDLSFNYQFTTTAGTLDVLLDSVVLASIEAPAMVPDEPTTFQLTVTDPLLFGLEDALLAFRFDGPTDSQILLTNIAVTAASSVPALPEDIDDVGPIDRTERTGLDLDEFDGERWFRLETERPGLLSLVVTGATEPETLDLTLYETLDGDPLLGTPVAQGQRILWKTSAAGEVYYVRLTGAGEVDLRLLNTWLWASPDPVTRPGELTLSTIGVEDAWGPVQQVEFYRGDHLLGTDDDGGDGWTWSGLTSGWTAGEYMLLARAQDADGDWSAMVSAFVVVENAIPRIDSLLAEPDQVTRPATLTLSAWDVADPDGDVVRVEFHRGEHVLGETDGSEGWTWSGSTVAWPLGEHAVYARAQDNDGAWSKTVSTTVTIANAPPMLTTIAPLPGASANEPFIVSYDALLTAADAFDPDGDAISFRVEGVTAGALAKNGEPVTAGETLLGAGEAWVWTPPADAGGVIEAFSVVAWDGLLASSAAVPVRVFVDPTGLGTPTVSSLAATSTGFTVQFNRELARSQLNLYDQGGLLGPADVSFMGPGGAEVRGSLVVSPDATSVTFIKTAGLLEPGAYTATLRSGATAFCDALGMDLDGDGDGVPGGDYVHSFVVDTPETEPVIASLPNVTRGYGQPVNLPADDLTAGLPLTISDGVNVSQVQFQLHYDPALLELQSFTVNAALAGGNATATLTFSAAGIASLSITAPANFAAQPGPLTIGSFTAVVPDDAPYGAKHVLDIADLQVFDAATPAAARTSLDRDAIHVAAFIGDTNGDGWYNSPDATLTRRIIGQINTGFGAYALADPVLFADITGNGIIQSNDTTAIRRAIGLIAVPDIPPLPGKLALSAAADADPGVAINGPNAAAADDESAAWYANDVNKDWLDAPLDALGVIHQRNIKGLSAAEGETRRPIPMLVANSRSVKLVVVEASNGAKRYWDAWGTDLLPLDAVLDDLVDDIAYAWDVEGEASW